MRAGASSTLIGVAVLAFGACSIDLSALQRTDGGINSATDPGDGTAGASGTNAADTAGSSGTAAAQSGTGGAGQSGEGGMSGMPSSPPVAGTTGGAGVSGEPAAGSTPPSAAGAPAAGAKAEPDPMDVPTKTCGLPGLPCCIPGNVCDIGACLRGKCTPYGGFYAVTAACTTNPCTSRNAYTAGCGCPAGFTDTVLWEETKSCDDAISGTTEVRSCTSGRTPSVAYGGAWVQGPDAGCKVGCRTPNPITKACACPAGTTQVSMTVDSPNGTCPASDTTLQVCIAAAAMAGNFGGAYAVSQTAASGCGAANPLTGACSCPEGVTTPQSLHAGTWSIFVCNL